VTAPSEQDDLICLVADRSIEAAVVGLLSRPKAIGIRRVKYVIRSHPEKDPGCYRHAHNFLSAFRKRYAHALVIFDREGCGNEGRSREELEEEVEGRLAGGGWRDRVRAVVLDPELECWVWSDSPHVDAALGWQGRTPALRSWLVENDLLAEGTTKPTRPKEAMEAAMRHVRRSRSSSIYRELAENVSVQRCTDPGFQKLRDTLREWFPAP
jgi:hypothetical protein